MMPAEAALSEAMSADKSEGGGTDTSGHRRSTSEGDVILWVTIRAKGRGTAGLKSSEERGAKRHRSLTSPVMPLRLGV